MLERKINACDVCHRAKETRLQFHASEDKAKDLFETVHCDIWGPYQVPSSCEAHYFLTLVDDTSRGVWLSLMKLKRRVTLELYLKALLRWPTLNSIIKSKF